MARLEEPVYPETPDEEWALWNDEQWEEFAKGMTWQQLLEESKDVPVPDYILEKYVPEEYWYGPGGRG